MSDGVETHRFQAEVNQILSLVVNSLYTHKEVFLRELLSNASDALDQLSFRALTDPDLLGTEKELSIHILPDAEARTLTISDTGVGMDHDELVQNLGTIAHSGSRKLVESLSGDQGTDLSLIGQFGVGFYSAFLVAERVTVISRKAGDPADGAHRWESRADGSFEISPAERDVRGTDVILHLREDEDDFLREWTLRQLVRKYSDFVRHPIRLRVEREKPVGDETDEHGAPKHTETTTELEQINTASALWTRPRRDVTREQYDEFYRHLTHDWEPPLAQTHFKVEGVQEMTGLLFIPKTAPVDLFARKRSGIHLFVKRVFIMEDCEQLLPEWLRFIRGVVDSEDLPLNVSREFLQKDRTSAQIRKQVQKHALSLLEDLARREAAARDAEAEIATESGSEAEAEPSADESAAKPGEDRDIYTRFWHQFGRILKEGIHVELAEKDRIAALLRFGSSRGEGLTSLDAYVERMPVDQTAIYHITAASRPAAETSPHIEALRARGYEVLFLTDPVDEWVVQGLPEFDGMPLVSAAKGNLELPEQEQDEKSTEERKGRTDRLADLTARMQEVLDAHVTDVRVSDRLTDSPACLVGDARALSPHLERLLRANGQDVPVQKRVLELNPDHPVVERLRAMVEAGGRDEEVADWSLLLHDQALVAEGSPPSDPGRFARMVADLMARAGG